MKLKELYNKDIDRKLNPAVSASDLAVETVKIEIEEYVFTEEIIQGLYDIMSAIMKKEKSHDGIWINGYFGSGKSHFLKYLYYCLSAEYGEKAMARLIEATEAYDPLQHSDSKLNLTLSDMKEVATWLKSNTVETIPFNIGTVSNVKGNDAKVFLEVFWAELNGFRGYNKFNIALAQHFEKVLDEKGKFDEFKQKMTEEGFDWNTQASALANNELDFILDIAKDLVPTMSIDIIRKKIVEDNTFISVETFMRELKSFIDSKGPKYHLIFLVDETSQFIANRSGLLLQLQEVVTRLHEVCADRVWVGCTAQQDLSELLGDCQIGTTNEDYGKIMGRFEVKISLKGTQPEYITQKRILDKNGNAEIELGKLYDAKKNAITNQFQLPASYHGFADKREFINYYPFVPYQFRLIMQVFNSFVNLGFVAREVKGNERSIIKVTHATAKKTKDEEVGKFISFDEFYNAMFQGSLMNLGQRAIKNAEEMAKDYKNPDFAKRVVNSLFMICYLSDTDKLLFPATIDNITNLLMTDVDSQKLSLKQDVQDVLDFLSDKNIIRRESAKGTAADFYCFYTEDEMEVAQLVKNQQVDSSAMAEELKRIFFSYMGAPANRESFGTSKFSVSGFVMGRNFLSNNADIEMELVMEDSFGGDPGVYALQNKANRLSFLIAPLYDADLPLKNEFFNYCKLQQFLKVRANSERRQQTMDEFRKRAAETFVKKIEPAFRKMFDECQVVSKNNIITAELTAFKGAGRYHEAMQKHLANHYPYANIVAADAPHTSDELKRAVLKPIDANEYTGLNATLKKYEEPVERYLSSQHIESNLSDVIKRFSDAPYGWHELATMFVVNELVRRHKRDYTYNGDPNADIKNIASALVSSDKNKVVIRPAEAIDPALVSNFMDAWKQVFGLSASASVDSSQIFRTTKESLDSWVRQYIEHQKVFSAYPFGSPISDMLQLFQSWTAERDIVKYFNLVVADSAKAKSLMDQCREVIQFKEDQLPKYLEFLKYYEDNHDNFRFLDDAQYQWTENFAAIKTDERPMDRMPSYRKLKADIENALSAKRKALCDEIAANYNSVHEQLKEVAEDNGVDVSILPDFTHIIQAKSSYSNLYTLKDNCNTQDFYQDWVNKIIAAKPKPSQPSCVSEMDNDPAPAKPIRTTKSISLNTLTTKTLTSESEVDAYLSGLKKQLMQHINNNEDVIIIK